MGGTSRHARHGIDRGHVTLIVVMMAVVGHYLWDTVSASQSAINLLLVPLVSLITLALLLSLLARALLGHGPPVAVAEPTGADPTPTWHTPAYLAIFALYVSLLVPLGFDVATCAFVAAALILKGERRVAMLLGYPLGFAILCTWAFKLMIPYPLPTLLPFP